jgi:hypothetical protein
MDTFNYLSVLFSVILGLALIQILQGFRALMLARSRVRLYWPALIWAALMILILVQAWWGMFGMSTFREWTFAMYAIVIFQITLMYLVAGLAMPDIPAEGIVNMREAYFAHKRWFFGLLALTVAATFLKDLITIGRIHSAWNAYYLEFFFVLTVVAAITRSRWFHGLLAPFSVAIVVVYIALLSARL